MAGTRLEWRGGAIKQRVASAERDAINEVMALCVGGAMQLVRVDTGNLKNTITITEPAHHEGGATVGVWGATAEYAIYQEIGPVTGVRYWSHTPYLRPSADRFYPQLAARIQRKAA